MDRRKASGVLLILALILLSAVIVNVLIPDFFGGLGVEIIGTLIGFLLALRANEALDEAGKRRREKSLFDNLVSEVENYLHTFGAHWAADDDAYMPMSIDLWEMAINSGEASLLKPHIRTEFIEFYNMARYYNQMFQIYQANPTKDMGELRKEATRFKSVLDICIIIAKKILKQHKPEGIPEGLRDSFP